MSILVKQYYFSLFNIRNIDVKQLTGFISFATEMFVFRFNLNGTFSDLKTIQCLEGPHIAEIYSNCDSAKSLVDQSVH